MKIKHIIVLSNQATPQFYKFFNQYIIVNDDQGAMFSTTYIVDGYFTQLEIVQTEKRDVMRPVKIPTHYIMAICDANTDDIKKYGFV